jgi:hypothetical protein
MSLIVCKYLPNYGFVGIKNDDKNYRPEIKAMKSFRDGVERLLVWDDISKYTEGINEFGISIICCPKQFKEEYRNVKNVHGQGKRYYSPSGFVVRKALLKRNCYEAAESVLSSKIDGHTIIFDSEHCLIVEMDVENNKHSIRELNTYDGGVAIANNSRNRENRCLNKIQYITSNFDLLDTCSECEENNDDSLILKRTNNFSINTYKTISQLMIVPSEKTLYYRSLGGKTLYDMETLNNRDSKTFFELVSTKKLITLTDLTER